MRIFSICRNRIMLNKSNRARTLISRVDRLERIKAFLVTSITVFVLACLIWPLSVTGFRSVGNINLDSNTPQTKPQLEKLLVHAVQAEATSENLDAIISEIEATERLQTDAIAQRDYEAIRKAIQIGVNQTDQQFTLRVVLDGQGRPDEQRLIDLLTHRVAGRLSVPQRATDFNPLDLGVPVRFQTASEFQSNQLESYERADWIIDQLERDLVQIRQSVQSLPDSTGSTPNRNAPDQRSQFKLASNARRVNTGVSHLSDSLDSIDVQSLRSLLTEMKTQLEDQQNAGLPGNTGTPLTIESLNRSKTRPIGGVPARQTLWMIAVLAGLAGSIVTWQFDPFHTRGFKNINELEQKLGIPVLATLRGDRHPVNNSARDKTTRWANRVVNISNQVLFGLFVVVAGFVITHSAIRESFFENPFFGIAKMVRLFAGY